MIKSPVRSWISDISVDDPWLAGEAAHTLDGGKDLDLLKAMGLMSRIARRPSAKTREIVKAMLRGEVVPEIIRERMFIINLDAKTLAKLEQDCLDEIERRTRLLLLSIAKPAPMSEVEFTELCRWREDIDGAMALLNEAKFSRAVEAIKPLDEFAASIYEPGYALQDTKLERACLFPGEKWWA